MGSYQNIYVGPYLIVDDKKIFVAVNRTVCDNGECKNFEKEIKSKFCPECGKETIDKIFQQSQEKNISDILYSDEFENEMFMPHNGGTDIFKNATIAIPNHSEGRPEHLDVESRDSGVYPMVSQDAIEADLVWFKQKFSAILNSIESEFGKSAMKIGWGIIVHYH